MTYGARAVAYSTVQWGRYFGADLAYMQAEQARYLADLAKQTPGIGGVVSASVNGSSFTNAVGGAFASYAEWQAEIQSAMSQLLDTVPDVPNATVAVMR